ncbi:MAG: dihydroxy-acid dehydratase [Pseudolabrys sp.]
MAILKTGDRVRIDLNKGTADILISKAELARRHAALDKQGGFPYPASQTPWQEIQRSMVDQLADGMGAQAGGEISTHRAKRGVPRDNH